MSDSSQVLQIVCSAMLQSWRNTTLGPNKGFTEIHPTKSGIAGMIACAMGYPKDDSRIETLKNSFELYLDINKSSSITNKENKIPDVMMDFQTVRSKNGMVLVGGTLDCNASLMEKEFLVNHKFVLYIKADDELLMNIQYALKNPVWDYYLGSKCCIPAEPVCGEIISVKGLEEEDSVYQHIRV